MRSEAAAAPGGPRALTRPEIAEAFNKLRGIRGLTVVEAARRAEVAPNAWVRLEQAQFGPCGSGKAFSDATNRQQRGWVQTALRLLAFYQSQARHSGLPTLERQQFLIGLEIDPNYASELDPIDSAARQRKRDSWELLKEGKLKVRLAAWPPFGPGAKSLMNPSDMKIQESNGWRILFSILGALAPASVKDIKVEPLVDMLEDGVTLLFEGGCDILFGIYDTADRRFNELDFYPLPGITFGLGALTTVEPTEQFWPELVHDLLKGGALGTRVITWEADVGYHFVAGQCRALDRTDTIPIGKPFAEIVEEFCDLVIDSPGKQVAFIGDAILCWEMKKAIDRGRSRARLPGELAVIGRDPESKTNFAIPRHRAGFVFRRGDALGMLIDDCLNGSLFPSFSTVLGFEYAGLFGQSMFLPDPYAGDEGRIIQHILITEIRKQSLTSISELIKACEFELGRLNPKFLPKILDQIPGWKGAERELLELSNEIGKSLPT